MSTIKTSLVVLRIAATVFIFYATSSCSKGEDICLDNSSSELSTKERFAEVLSAAVSNSEELRCFIKDEALLQFDKDYDVFYPFSKDKLVYDGKTFRECLLDYVEETTLRKIEDDNPFLTIYVPDWEWLGAFSINKWQTSSDDVFVGIDDGGQNHRLYAEGAYFGTLNNGEFPMFPVMIVKDNERMTLTLPTTRVETARYSFIDEAFDNSSNTRVTAEEYRRYFTVTPGSNYISKSDFAKVSQEAIDAWNEYGDDPYESQRNMVYFNSKKNENKGTINPKIREAIVAVKLIDTNCMEEDEGDPYLQKTKKKRSDFSDEDLLNEIWSDGNLEIKFHVTTLDQNNQTIVLCDNALSVRPKDLFDVPSIKCHFYHKSAFSPREYVYLPTKTDLVSKWYYLPDFLKFDFWDLAKESTALSIYVYEIDAEVKEEVEMDESLTKQNSIAFGVKVGGKYELSFDFNAPTNTVKRKYTINKGSDALGNQILYYNDYIIRSESSDNYELNYYGTGKINFIIVPVK